MGGGCIVLSQIGLSEANIHNQFIEGRNAPAPPEANPFPDKLVDHSRLHLSQLCNIVQLGILPIQLYIQNKKI